MIETSHPNNQGRAPGLYDEQLQRQQQEKHLAHPPAEGGTLLEDGRRRFPAPPERERPAFFQKDHHCDQDDIDFMSEL